MIIPNRENLEDMMEANVAEETLELSNGKYILF